ncbi:MAG TPA: diadenylate cyclase CdaA [Gemmatimonadales bacterium]|nr:diadenylate cyclase CdaA [Gemmatimonadales bacterium]
MLIPSLFSRLPPLTVAALFDILILALVIYQILWMVREARATPFLIWVGLLAAVYYGAQWTGLRTVEWLLSNIFPYLVLAMIVLFQAEIRRGLARIGRNPFRPGFSSFETRQAFEDILMAVSLFASQKIGALIVLERKINLRTYAESGIPLQARLSYDLLVAIFQPRAPLHDGAVIISKDKIAAAACFLPLSINPIWGTQIGTRHRAAVGITEETDAVALVVSEETGAISLAVSGSIELDISVERLAERLSELFGYPLPSAGAGSARRPPLEEPPPVRTAERISMRDEL